MAGFAVVVQDIVLGAYLTEMIHAIRSRPLLLVVLAPQPSAIADREAGRAKNAYGTFTIEELDEWLRRDTPRLGIWLDSTSQSADQTAAQILHRAWTDAGV
jgi:hypothetical protein